MTGGSTSYWLQFTLESDATLGRGDGVAGVVDAEVQHDEYGFPYLSGKTLKGLLCAECAEILFALDQIGQADLVDWRKAALFLFGKAGSQFEDHGRMRVSDAQLPDDLRAMEIAEFRNLQALDNKQRRDRKWGVAQRATLESLTALRRQTAMDPKTGAPLKHALRTMRVVLRETPFIARLDINASPENISKKSKCLLAACVKAFRRAGTGRNRGRGRLCAELYDQPLFDQKLERQIEIEPVTPSWFQEFEQEVRQ